jgi:2-keto-4-pentenoate hydratase/2-oxohepta-3-ene-1,7-dioic acid hydratase in catechol pathway
MLISRFLYQNVVRFGIVERHTMSLLQGDVFNRIEPTGERVERDEVCILSPVEPALIIGLGRNYRGHIEEIGEEPPDIPAVFFKPGRTIIGHREPVMIPEWATRVDYEGELGVIIGRKMRCVSEESAGEYVFGYTCFNDITERHIGMKGLINQDISKCCDTFGPCGPWISTDFDPCSALIRTYCNGEIVQEDNTENMVYSVNQVLCFLSKFMTLMPGDLVITGTPGGIGPVNPGDTVEVEIEGIGRLTNPVEKVG